jgi:Skp family chaperone for outer membrane proteins
MNETQKDSNAVLGSALGTDMNSAPYKMPDVTKMKMTSENIMREQAKMIPALAAAKANEKSAELEFQTNLESEKAKAINQVADSARTHISETQKKEKDFPYPEFHPTQENAQSLGELFSLVSTLGIMLGSSGKMAAMNSLNAMNGMLSGWQKGRADLFKREKETFDKEFNRIKALKDEMRKDLDDYMKLLPYDKEAAMYKAAELAAKAGKNSIVDRYLQTGQLEALKQWFDSSEKVLARKEEIQARRAELKQPSYSFFTTPEGKVMAVNIHNPADIKEVPKELAGAVKLGTAPKEKGLPKKGESQAKFVGDAIGRPVDVDAASKLTSGLSYIQGLKELQEKNLTLGNVAGLSVAIADKVNGLLKPELDPLTRTQTIDITQEALDKAWTEAQKDKSFTSLSEKSKVMAKKELDTIMLNLQTKYGNRAPVAEFRAAQAVLSRRTSDPVAFNRTMQEETIGTYRRLNQLGFDRQDIDKMDNKLKSLESESLSSAPSLSTQSDIDTVTGFPKISDKGWTLMPDGKGNYAYISPNGIKKINAGRSSDVTKDEIEELQ